MLARNGQSTAGGAGLQRDLEVIAAIIAACAAGGDSGALGRISSPGFGSSDDALTARFAAMVPNMAGDGAASLTGPAGPGVAR